MSNADLQGAVRIVMKFGIACLSERETGGTNRGSGFFVEQRIADLTQVYKSEQKHKGSKYEAE